MTEIDDACIVVTACVGVLAMSQQRKPAHYFHQEEKSSSIAHPTCEFLNETPTQKKIICCMLYSSFLKAS